MITEAPPEPVLARRRRVVLIIGSVMVLVVVAVIIVSLVRGSGSDDGPTEDSGLLQWPPRGALAEDASLIDAAKALWRAGSDVDQAAVVVPNGEIFVLWADRDRGWPGRDHGGARRGRPAVRRAGFRAW